MSSQVSGWCSTRQWEGQSAQPRRIVCALHVMLRGRRLYRKRAKKTPVLDDVERAGRIIRLALVEGFNQFVIAHNMRGGPAMPAHAL